MKRFVAAAWLDIGSLAVGLLCLCAAPMLAQKLPRQRPQAPQVSTQADGAEQEPPEEDESLKPNQEYTFNPLQADKEMKIGAFYFKRGSFRAAALRFEEATKWNAGMAEAFKRLGEAREKLDENAEAVAAYKKYLELAPDAKDAATVKKKLGPLSKKG